MQIIIPRLPPFFNVASGTSCYILFSLTLLARELHHEFSVAQTCFIFISRKYRVHSPSKEATACLKMFYGWLVWRYAFGIKINTSEKRSVHSEECAVLELARRMGNSDLSTLVVPLQPPWLQGESSSQAPVEAITSTTQSQGTVLESLGESPVWGIIRL